MRRCLRHPTRLVQHREIFWGELRQPIGACLDVVDELHAWDLQQLGERPPIHEPRQVEYTARPLPHRTGNAEAGSLDAGFLSCAEFADDLAQAAVGPLGKTRSTSGRGPSPSTSYRATRVRAPISPARIIRRLGGPRSCGLSSAQLLLTVPPMMEHGGTPMAGHAHDERKMLVDEHLSSLWPHYVNLLLGLWLITSPFALGYLSEFVPDANVLRVMQERNLPSFEWRNAAMTWSDVASGALIVLFSLLAASPSRRYPWSQWANAVVGFWLLFAPIVFWTPLPEAYANGTLVGALVIAFSVLIPMMPGMSMRGMMGGPDVPPGWSYTPSSWLQRLPMAVLAVLGLLISRYLTAYQLGHIDRAWDPFFGQGTMTIITSDMSRAWPVADAGVGTIAYIMELLMAVMGDKRRWRTMPWMVLGFFILVVPLGGVSIFFIIMQPIAIGTWCTLCLIAALFMALMIPYALDEFVAMSQFMLDARRKGKPLWRTLWIGDAMEGGTEDGAKEFRGTTREIWAEAVRGVTIPPALILGMAIGVWLMFTRLTFGNSGAMANSDHLVGALVVTVAITAWAEVARPLRFINVLFGGWLIAAPWLLDGAGSALSVWNGVASGALLSALSLPRGPVRDHYAGWDRYVF